MPGKKQKKAPVTPQKPTQQGGMGVRFDFNCGARILLPAAGGPYHVTVWDTETGTVFADGEYPAGARIATTKKYFVPYAFKVTDTATGEAFTHRMDLAGRTVCIHVLVSTLGDVLAWLPQAEKFTQKHGCETYVSFADRRFKPLFRKQYPALRMTSPREAAKLEPYASFLLGLWWHGDTSCQPYDHRFVGLAQTAGYILGVDPQPVPPRLDLSAPRQIAEPYVCIAAQSSTFSKNWHAEGWRDIVFTLEKLGWRVLCIDRDRQNGSGEYVTPFPEGAEDFTGDRPLQERIDLLKDADFFIGNCSGLAWLAWACHVPVVMIGGFSHPLTEFPTPYRVINPHFCNSCWNDPHFDFDHADWTWCPRHKGTARQYECMQMITPEHVMRVISRIPVFRKHMETI